MRVGWITDRPEYVGGAEMTQREFRAATPVGVEVVDCFPGEVEPGLDRYVAHNVTQFAADDLKGLDITWYHHDLSPWVKAPVRRLLDAGAHLFCSPLQRDRYAIDGLCIPPQLDLDRYRPARQTKRHREGKCSIAAWMNWGKGPDYLREWAAENGPVDVYGSGGFVPAGPGIENKGELEPDQVATTLFGYKTFVFLPSEIEPFCRCVVEAWLAGCELVVNRNIGAIHWIKQHPEKLETAAEDFWDAVLN